MDKLGRVMGKINSQKDLRDTLKNNRENWPFGEKIAILYDFANDDTSREWVRRARTKSLLSSGNTCVLSWSRLKEALWIIL